MRGLRLFLTGASLLFGAVLTGQEIKAKPTDGPALQRAGYTVEKRGGDFAGSMIGYTYTYKASDFIVQVLDNDMPPPVAFRREIAFSLQITSREGRSAADIASVTPKMVASADRALRTNAGVVAAVGYLATVAGDVSPEALKTAILSFLGSYQQPGTPLRRGCPDCDPLPLSDEYDGGPDLNRPLRVGTGEWKIEAVRLFLGSGRSAFLVGISAKVPRNAARIATAPDTQHRSEAGDAAERLMKERAQVSGSAAPSGSINIAEKESKAPGPAGELRSRKAAPSAAAGKWQRNTVTDEMDDSKTPGMHVTADESEGQPTLMFLCSGGHLSAGIGFDLGEGMNLENLGSKLQVRFDRKPAFMVDVQVAGSLISFPNLPFLVDFMSTAPQRLTVKLFMRDGVGSMILHFDTRGFEQAARPIVRSCR